MITTAYPGKYLPVTIIMLQWLVIIVLDPTGLKVVESTLKTGEPSTGLQDPELEPTLKTVKPPTGLKALESTLTTVKLSWDILDFSVDECVIEYRIPIKSTAWERRYDLDYNLNNAIITGLDTGTEYEFRLRVETVSGSAHSNTVVVKTKDWWSFIYLTCTNYLLYLQFANLIYNLSL